MTVIRQVSISLKWILMVSFINLVSLSNVVSADVFRKLAEGDKARFSGKYAEAEKIYAEALAEQPENYRILKSLAEVKVALKKYAEAKPLAKKILDREVMVQKKVRVYRGGEPEALEAELVDERVIAPDTGKNNMRNYLDSAAREPVPHYRLFFFKKGKMELVPQSQVRIEYVGVPRIIHEQTQELYDKIQRQLIAAFDGGKKGEMVEVGGDCFNMGSDKGSPRERPIHEVCVSSFKIDKYEVSQRDFQSVLKTNPSRFVAGDLPVESVTWLEADEFCRETGKRLPTEAEWEFAARGGTKTEFYWGDAFDPSKGNFCDESCELNIRLRGASDGYKHTAPVGKFPPNPLGLYDMAGNVAEWVNDNDSKGENYYIVSPRDNPKGPLRHDAKKNHGEKNDKIFRGGSWEGEAETLRSAWRKALWVDYRIDGLGFRCVGSM